MVPWAWPRWPRTSSVWWALRRPWETAEARLWLLLGLWTVGVIGFFTFSPFKLPHYGLPAFPAMALLVAKLWDEGIEGESDAPSLRGLLWPPLIGLVLIAAASTLTWRGVLGLSPEAVSVADMASRNLAAQGQQASLDFLSQFRPLIGGVALVCGLGAAGIALSLWRRQPALGVGALLATMLAFLPISVEGLSIFAKGRSVRPIAEAVTIRMASGDIFWDGRALAEAWRGPRRVFLISGVRPAKSLTRDLPPDRTHLLVATGGRWLYSNRP